MSCSVFIVWVIQKYRVLLSWNEYMNALCSFSCTALPYDVLHRTVPYCTVLYRTVPYRTVCCALCCAAGEGIIVTGIPCRADNDAPLLLQAQSCFLTAASSSFAISNGRLGRAQASWSIPIVQLGPPRGIYELPMCANWRP